MVKIDTLKELKNLKSKLFSERARNATRIGELEKGSIQMVNEKYYVLKYRAGDHVKSRYLQPDEVDDVQKQIDERKQLSELQKQYVKEEEILSKTIEKIEKLRGK